MEENKDVKLEVLSEEDLNAVSGGRDGKVGLYEGPWAEVCNLKAGYLAIRNQPAYDFYNEEGALYNGEYVQIIGNGSGNGYIWVWSPKLNKSGWGNSNFIRQLG